MKQRQKHKETESMFLCGRNELFKGNKEDQADKGHGYELCTRGQAQSELVLADQRLALAGHCALASNWPLTPEAPGPKQHCG